MVFVLPRISDSIEQVVFVVNPLGRFPDLMELQMASKMEECFELMVGWVLLAFLLNSGVISFIYMSTSYKGKFTPQNPNKYVGDPTKIVYRSLWERKFMVFCDQTPNIIKWGSEEISIPYFSPIDNEYHYYYPDFIVRVNNKQNELKTYLIEIKPQKQCKEPEKGKKSNKTYLTEMTQWIINNKKWEAAKKFATQQQWEFKILTEKTLNL
jgi:hypothetical protein